MSSIGILLRVNLAKRRPWHFSGGINGNNVYEIASSMMRRNENGLRRPMAMAGVEEMLAATEVNDK